MEQGRRVSTLALFNTGEARNNEDPIVAEWGAKILLQIGFVLLMRTSADRTRETDHIECLCVHVCVHVRLLHQCAFTRAHFPSQL